MNKSEMLKFFFDDPKSKGIEKQLDNNRLQYFYFKDDLSIHTEKKEVLNGCLLKGQCELKFENFTFKLDQFDLFFLPPEKEISIHLDSKIKHQNKICLYYSRIKDTVEAKFEIQQFSLDKFIPRGEFSSETKMATYRTVWTAFKNGYFMSGFTNIPKKALKQGVVTSVNIESPSDEDKEIFPHIHPDFPEVYIFCIDDDNYAVTQYLIDDAGKSVCQDIPDGGGVFFPGYLGHLNFAKPFGKNIKYCMYLWFISTQGETHTVNPITLRV